MNFLQKPSRRPDLVSVNGPRTATKQNLYRLASENINKKIIATGEPLFQTDTVRNKAAMTESPKSYTIYRFFPIHDVRFAALLERLK